MKEVSLRFELSRRKNIHEKYVVKCFLGSKRRIKGYYYAEDWRDALAMIERLADQFGLKINKLDNNLIVASEECYI